jgi:hypothetical protein
MPAPDIEAVWTEEAEEQLLGKRVVGVRYLSAAESLELGWFKRCLLIEFEDGTRLYPSSDDEGNCPGAFLGEDSHGGDFRIPIL